MDLNLIPAKGKTNVAREKGMLNLELAEIREISDLIFQKLEKKMQAVQALESSVDAKIAALEGLIQRAESLNSGGIGDRQQDIIALRKKGLDSDEIAEVLNMPRGEVDLTLNLHMLAE